jgi:hypothetical protein
MVSLEVEAAMGIVMPVNFFFFLREQKRKEVKKAR